MVLIKSFSVGNGDMFYINHDSDNFSIIDCCLPEENRNSILDEIYEKSRDKNICRFISTHPDNDHIFGLEDLDEKINILNFYCVQNEATKEDETSDFEKYCDLRDSEEKSFYIKEGCSRKWMNKNGGGRKHSGINILWPKTHSSHFQDELENVKEGKSPNNISPIIKYGLNNGISAIWMGDLENSFMENIESYLDLSKIDILFAPHHGRKTGRIPSELLNDMDPEIIIVGEAPSEDLEYYDNYNTITQNSSGDILFECLTNETHIYVSNENYSVDFLENESKGKFDDLNYIGTLNHNH